MPKRKAVPPKPEYHDVVFTISAIERGAIVIERDQAITARMIFKLEVSEVKKLNELTGEYLAEYQEGAGKFLVTARGRFSR